MAICYSSYYIIIIIAEFCIPYIMKNNFSKTILALTNFVHAELFLLFVFSLYEENDNGEGFCQEYKGATCATYIGNRSIYVTSLYTQVNRENRFMGKFYDMKYASIVKRCEIICILVADIVTLIPFYWTEKSPIPRFSLVLSHFNTRTCP